ncbi:MAG: ATP-binding protein [Acidobacteriota bacterium]
MRLPPVPRRAVARAIVGGVIGAAAVAGLGLVGERVRFGADLQASRDRIERDVRAQFGVVSTRLEAAAESLREDAAVIAVIRTREVADVRRAFDRLAVAERDVALPDVAITVYGVNARPVAWAGRPSTLPVARLTGPDASFLVSSPLGLRLTRVVAVTDAVVADRRVAAVVAEAALPGAGAPGGADRTQVETSVIAVPVRPGFEAPSSDTAMLVRTADGLPLAVVDVSSEAIEVARRQWRARVFAAEALLVGALLLGLSGPLLEWRRRTRTVGAHLTATCALVVVFVSARAMAWAALRMAGLDGPPLAPETTAGPLWVALASPLDFLLTILLLTALVALAATSVEQCRRRRGRRRRAVSREWPSRMGACATAQLAAGTTVGALLVGYEQLLDTRLVAMPHDLLHFSLSPIELPRLALGMGLVVLHAALFALSVLILRVASAPWVFAERDAWMRVTLPLLWLVPAIGVLMLPSGQVEPPTLPLALAATAVVAAAWRLRRYTVALKHASQAARLTAFLVSLAVPTVVFYPLLVDATNRARRQLVESQYALEVVNQRRQVQLRLDEARLQIDALPNLVELAEAGAASALETPSTDAAFLVWARTSLANQRSTSIDLHDGSGVLVSRFSLDLPEAVQLHQESSCEWEVFEEVSPFFAEERRLLHAGRGICSPNADGTPRVVGAVVVHAMLDYSNLSFISAQSPYVALLSGPPRVADAREAIEFTVYGWSRRPLYMSGRDAWPLTEDVFARVLASRMPFWATVRRGDVDHEVYFLNDRGAIYALGFARASPFEHLISIAEVVGLAATAYAALLVVALLYGAIAARAPASGRALLREIRASFYRKLFIAFVAAAVVPVLALALLTRAYLATLMQADLEMEAIRTAASASRVVEDVGALDAGSGTSPAPIEELVVWLSRVMAQEVNIFDGSGLLASSERNLFASGLLPTRTQGDVYRAIALEGRPAYVGRESVGAYGYLVAAAPVRVRGRDAILTVPLTLRQQETDAQIHELDRRVLLAALLFIMLGGAIGYWMAERIADPVNRLTRATGRIARGDLDVRILPTSSDEFRRLVDAFNRMADDLRRQRTELERTNRLAAWADAARQVAHDIKNPLTPIQLNAEHLRRVHADQGAPLGPLLDECVTNVLTQVRLLRQIASEFSSFATAPTPKLEPTTLADLLEEVVQPYRVGLSPRVSVDLDISRTLPHVLVDRLLLARAVTNVIENALHAMPAGGRLSIKAAPVEGEQVELTVSDTGVGMDREALARIFEPYFSTRASGSGLGLTIAKRNVELNGGTITVTSARGVGTTVRMALPAAPMPTGAATASPPS